MPRLALLVCLCILSLPARPAAAIGVEQVRKHPKGTDVALVFVHGLGGGPCSSFESGVSTAKSDDRTFACPRYEPGSRQRGGQHPLSWFTIIDRDGKIALPGDRTMVDLDLYTVSYIDASRAAISATAIGESLARNPEFLRIFDDYNHVLFVAHSMGGIVLRRAIVRLQLSPERARVDRIVGVALLGSPSEGSPLADRVMDWGYGIPGMGILRKVFGKVCWGEYVDLWYGVGWHQITDLQTLEGHNHLLAGLQTDWGTVLAARRGTPLTVTCAYETVPEVLALKLSVVERIYTHTAGCLEQIPLNFKHTELTAPIDTEDNRHQWLRDSIIKALTNVGEYKLRNWPASYRRLGELIDLIDAEGRLRPLPGALGERIGVSEGSEKAAHFLYPIPGVHNYGGPTYGALLQSISESNPCLKVKLDRRRRKIEVRTEGAVECPAFAAGKRAFACELRGCP